MKSILPEALNCHVWVNGKRHKLKPTVANVMRAMDDLKDVTLLKRDRAKLACWRLYAFPRPKDYIKAVDAAFEFLDEPSPYRQHEHKQTLNLTQDAAMICAAFQQLYNINLPQTAHRMDWRYFQALLGGITSDTALGGIMDIRSMKIPKRTASNGEYIAEIQNLKLTYRVRQEGYGTDKSFEDGMRGMVEVLMAMAGGEH